MAPQHADPGRPGLWQRLTQPAAQVQVAAQREQAALLSALSLVLFVVSIVTLTITRSGRAGHRCSRKIVRSVRW